MWYRYAQSEENTELNKTPITKFIAELVKNTTSLLPPKEFNEIEKYQQGVYARQLSQVDHIYLNDNGEFRARFDPVREALKAKFGDNIVLFRAEDITPGLPGKPLSAYTHNPKIAQAFLRPGRRLVQKIVPIEAIYAVIKKHDAGGERPIEFLVENSKL